jgi:hypothetical protein
MATRKAEGGGLRAESLRRTDESLVLLQASRTSPSHFNIV